MRKGVPFAFIKHRVQSAASICTRLLFKCGCSRSPNIHNSQKEYPHNIHKVPVKNCQILCNTTIFARSRQQEQTYHKVQGTNDDMSTVEASSQIEGTTKDRVTESKWRTGIFQILTENKLNPQKDCICQLKFTKGFISTINGMFCRVRSKVRPEKQKSVCFRKSSPMNRYHSQRRPAHSLLNSRHESPVKEGPKLSDEKHCFGPDKKIHSQLKSGFNFPSVKTKNTFTVYITPPQTSSISHSTNSNNSKGTSPSILMKIQNQRNHHPQNTQPSQSRPRTGINQMIPMVRPSSMPSSARHLLGRVLFQRGVLLPNSNFLHFFLSVKQSHCFE